MKVHRGFTRPARGITTRRPRQIWLRAASLTSNAGALIIRIGFSGILYSYCNYSKEPQNSIGNYLLRPLYYAAIQESERVVGS